MNVDRPTANALERLLRRVQLLVGRGRIKTGSDTGPVQVQQVQVNDREIHDNMPRIGEYGFASMPLPGCQALVIFVAGERTNGVIVGTNDEAKRLKGLRPGEAAIYDDQGQSVWIKREGIVIESAGKPITINGDVILNGSLTASGDVTAEGTSLHTHVHGGVAAGGSNTGAPV